MPWFFNIDRQEAERRLRNLSNGTFLVRPSAHGGVNHSHTLSLQFKGRIFHISIRQRDDGRIALGNEKIKEQAFTSIPDAVRFFQTERFRLHTGSELAGSTRLNYWPKRTRKSAIKKM